MRRIPLLGNRIPILKKEWDKTRFPEGKGIICNWVREDEDMKVIDMKRYSDLLKLLPDKVVENLERARLERAGIGPMLRSGLGYEELLSSVVVDGTAIASSSTEAFLFPALYLPPNFLQPGGVPGKTLHWKARGRHTTLTTAATLIFKVGAAVTNVIPTTTWAVSGPITMDTTLQTATMWKSEGAVVIRSVGSAGTVFAEGDAESAAQALTIANQQANYMGSAGSATPSTAACDMTLGQYTSLTAKWSLATAYSIQGHVFIVESLN
jgi:hypothetical protein